MNDREKLIGGIAGKINEACRENDSNTPDFLLGEYLVNCLEAFELINNRREGWYGVYLDILNTWKELIMVAIGEASMCWSETPKGVFDSDKAAAIGKKLLQDMKKERV